MRRFAIAMLVVAGVVNVLYGVVGLGDDHHYASDGPIFGAVELWGGVNLVIGAIYLMIVLLLVKRVPSGVPLAVMMAGINAVAQMMAVGAYPIYSLTVLAVDVVVIYALLVDDVRESP